jgi:hypothetical protein
VTFLRSFSKMHCSRFGWKLDANLEKLLNSD